MNVLGSTPLILTIPGLLFVVPAMVTAAIGSLMQKQQVEMENAESDRALEELKKASDDDQVFKYAGTILIKSDKKSLIDELEEKKELSKTKSTVLAKQEERLKTTLQEQEQKIQEMLKNPPPVKVKKLQK